MLKFISGAIVGGALVGLGFYLTAQTPPPEEDNPLEQLQDPNARLDGPETNDAWTNVGDSRRLGVMTWYPVDAPERAPVLPADFPILSLQAETTLGTATRADIARVCVQPDWAKNWNDTELATDKTKPVKSFTVRVWLKDEARRQLGAEALAHDGATGAFVFNAVSDHPTANHPFILSRFVTDAETIGNYLAPSDEPDLYFMVPKAAAKDGLAIAKKLAGGNSLEPCEAGDDLTMVPEYDFHQYFWDRQINDYQDRLKRYEEIKKQGEAEASEGN